MKIKIDSFDDRDSCEGEWVFIESKFGTFSIHEDKKGLSIMERSNNHNDISIIPYLGNTIFIKKESFDGEKR